MSELKERFRALDRVPAPDLWPDIRQREPAEIRLGPRPGRVLATVVALLVAVAGIGVAARAFLADGPRPVVTRVPITPKANGKIAFVAGERLDEILFVGSDLFQMDPNGRNRRRLTQGRSFLRPDWSPDGSMLVAQAGTGMDGSNAHLWLVKPDDGERQITEGSVVDIAPDWSPSGRRIVFSRAVWDGPRFNGYDLYTVDPQGKELSRITEIAGNETAPDWSPDGTEIAFVGGRSDTAEAAIFVVGLEGSGLVRLTMGHEDANPTWSPDGSRLAFLRRLPDEKPDRIMIMNSDGTSTDEVFACGGKCGAIFDVGWSPDGSKLVFTLVRVDADQHPHPDIYVINSDGTGLRRLTNRLGGCCPAWQPLPVRSPGPEAGPTASS